LASIEEQPELGYSSESEANFEPFLGKISSESNTSTTLQLDSLLEQEETNNKGSVADNEDTCTCRIIRHFTCIQNIKIRLFYIYFMHTNVVD